jgi:formylmethanofuran dehydrogenase subunit B
MKVGLLLGEFLGGIVDSISSICDGAIVMGVQESGRVGATAGQSKIRSDLVVFWGADPMNSMPRHMSRYAIFPRGYWTRRGWLDRKIITINCSGSKLSDISDLDIKLKANTDYEFLSALLALLHGRDPHPSAEIITGVSISKMKELLEKMKGCNFGVIYLGAEFSSSRAKYRNVELAIHLVKELNGFAKFVLNSLRNNCNTGGFNQIACSLYGYPFGLDFSRGYPRYNPGEFTTVDLLRDRDVDAALLISSGLDAHLPMNCLEYLAELPVVSIDAFVSPIAFISDVVLPEVVDAVECEGTFYRYDEVALYSKSITYSPFEFTDSNEHTLRQILDNLKNIKDVK